MLLGSRWCGDAEAACPAALTLTQLSGVLLNTETRAVMLSTQAYLPLQTLTQINTVDPVLPDSVLTVYTLRRVL